MNFKDILGWFTDEPAVEKKELTLQDYGEWLNILEGNGGSTLSKPYSQSAIVYKAINSISENFPQCAYRIYQNGNEVPTTHPISQLFMKPNSKMSRYEMWEATAVYLNLYGECFWYISTSVTGKPLEIAPLNPSYMEHTLDGNNNIIKWVFNSKIPFDPSELIHFKFFNPYNTIRGLSPLTAATMDAESDFYATNYNRKFFKNNSRPDAVLELDKDKSIDIKQMRKLYREWNQQHQGQENTAKMAILQGGMKYKIISQTSKEMDFVNSLGMTRDRILSVFGVPLFIAGYGTENMNRATAFAARRQFWVETIKPQLLRVQEKLSAEFYPRFAPELTGTFDLKAVEELRRDLIDVMKVATSFLDMGYTRNEINERLGLEMPPSDDNEDLILSTRVPRSMNLDLEPLPEPVPEKAITSPITKQNVKLETKSLHHSRFLKAQRKMEAKYKSKLKRYLYEQRKEVLSLLPTAKATVDEVLLNVANIWTNQDVKLLKLVTPLFKENIEAGYRLANANLGISTAHEIDADLLDIAAKRIVGINDTVWKTLRKSVFDGTKAGETLAQIADRVKGVYNSAASRAVIIARTETGKIMNAASFSTYKKEGVEKKQWLSSPDSRSAHVDNSTAGAIPMDGYFPSGQKFPGDGSDASLVVNCTCSISPIIE